jgi:hypothetical protein
MPQSLKDKAAAVVGAGGAEELTRWQDYLLNLFSSLLTETKARISSLV